MWRYPATAPALGSVRGPPQAGLREIIEKGTNAVNKSELVQTVAARLNADHKSTAAILDAILDEVSRALVKGERVTLVGFGTFEKRARAARTARNPRTGATIKLKKTSVPAFKAGAAFKQVVSGEKKLPAPAAKRPAAAKKAGPAKKSAPAAKKAAAKKTPARKAAGRK